MGRPLDGRAGGPTDEWVGNLMDRRLMEHGGGWGGKRGWVSGQDGWMDGETIGWTGEWPDGRVNGMGRRGWVSGPDGWEDHWMDGRMARRTGEWGGKAGVAE